MKKYTVTVNGISYDVTVEEAGAGASPAPAAAPPAPSAKPAAAPSPKPAAPAAPQGSVKIESPMPGTILDVKASVGASVNEGEALIILEAMKMENEIVAPSAGTVASVEVNKGDSVEAGQVLVTLK